MENTNQVEAEKGSPAFKSSGGKRKCAMANVLPRWLLALSDFP